MTFFTIRLQFCVVCKSINLEREPVERSLIFTWNCWVFFFFYSVTLGLLSEIRDHEMLVCWPRLSPWRLCKSPRVDRSPAVWTFLLALFSITSDSKDKVYGQKHWLDVTWWPRGWGCNKCFNSSGFWVFFKFINNCVRKKNQLCIPDLFVDWVAQQAKAVHVNWELQHKK